MKLIFSTFLALAALASGATTWDLHKVTDGVGTNPKVTAANSSLFTLNGSGTLTLLPQSTFALAESNTGTNTGDQISIVGITGTKAQFQTAMTDDDFVTLLGNQTLGGFKTFAGEVVGEGGFNTSAGSYQTGSGQFMGPGTGLTGTAAGLSIGGNALTATTLQNSRTIGGSTFSGAANVTSFPSPGAIGGTTPSTAAFTTASATTFTGALVGNASTATTAAGLSATLAVGSGGTGVATSGTTSQIAVGGGTGSPIVWTTATGTGAPMRGTSPTITTGITFAGGGSITEASGAVNVTAGGTNKEAALISSGSGTARITATNGSLDITSELWIFARGSGGSERLRIDVGNVNTGSGSVYGWTSASTSGVTRDTGLSRKTSTATWIMVGNGTANDASGTIQATKFAYSATVFDSAGTGSPESVLTAGISSTYRRTDGGAGTSFYIKESGTGTTGWVAK